MKQHVIRSLGGTGSGHHGHRGRKGKRGGSLPKGGRALAPGAYPAIGGYDLSDIKSKTVEGNKHGWETKHTSARFVMEDSRFVGDAPASLTWELDRKQDFFPRGSGRDLLVLKTVGRRANYAIIVPWKNIAQVPDIGVFHFEMLKSREPSVFPSRFMRDDKFMQTVRGFVKQVGELEA